MVLKGRYNLILNIGKPSTNVFCERPLDNLNMERIINVFWANG